MLSKNSIALLGETESQLKLLRLIAANLKLEIDCEIFDLDKVDVKTISGLKNYKLAISALSNKSTRLMMSILSANSTRRRPLVIAIFPGFILNRSFYDTVATRAQCDFLLFPTKHEASKAAMALSLCYGDNNWHQKCVAIRHPLFQSSDVTFEEYESKSKELAMNESVKFLFVDQTDVPSSLAEREKVAEILKELVEARRHEIRIRPKVFEGQKSGHPNRAPMEVLLDNLVNKNPRVFVSERQKSVKDDILWSDCVISFSSTVLIEALLMGKPAVSIADMGIRERYGNDSFMTIGIVSKLGAIYENGAPVASSDFLEEFRSGVSVEYFLQNLLMSHKDFMVPIPPPLIPTLGHYRLSKKQVVIDAIARIRSKFY